MTTSQGSRHVLKSTWIGTLRSFVSESSGAPAAFVGTRLADLGSWLSWLKSAEKRVVQEEGCADAFSKGSFVLNGPLCILSVRPAKSCATNATSIQNCNPAARVTCPAFQLCPYLELAQQRQPGITTFKKRMNKYQGSQPKRLKDGRAMSCLLSLG